MRKPNALTAIFDLAVEARDDDALWEPVQQSGTKSGLLGTKSVWLEVGTREVGSEVGRFYAFHRPFRYPPGRHIVIALKLIVGRLTLKFSRVQHRSKPQRQKRPRSRRLTALNRKNWRRLRQAYQHFKSPPSDVPLMRDDAELRALLALRCMQQNYHADAARKELRDYARKLGVPDKDDMMNDVLNRLVELFVFGVAGGLPKYIRAIKTAVLAEDAEVRPRNAPKGRGELLTVSEAALELGLSRRTVYQWIQQGIVVPAQKSPYRIAMKEVERVRERMAKPGTLYRIVMNRRGCSYDVARLWVGRRLAKGAAVRKIIEEAAAFNSVH